MTALVRLRLDLTYDASEFAGWARQPAQRTVQGVLEDALARVMRLDPAPVLTVAGRTPPARQLQVRPGGAPAAHQSSPTAAA